jgi:hypothetical protein
MLPVEPRLPEARELIGQAEYFVLHAPRQTGKTTLVRTLAELLTAEGKFAALYVSCEEATKLQTDDVRESQWRLLEAIAEEAADTLPAELRPPEWPDRLSPVRAGLRAWSKACPRPVVVFLDEFDGFKNDVMADLLGQIRAGHADRLDGFFPWSIGMIGMRQVRDFKVDFGRSSPFNIQTTMRLPDFTRDEVVALLGQHTTETGQRFDDSALEAVWQSTFGQPWLVNALAKEATERMNVPRSETITGRHIDEAASRLIKAQAMHLDNLASRLLEPRVRSVIEPMMTGTDPDYQLGSYDRDVSYVRDLGLIAADDPVRPANPIYWEVLHRALSARAEGRVRDNPRDYVRPDGTFDYPKFLDGFIRFWKETGDALSASKDYYEIAPHTVMYGWMHKIGNGGGDIHREYPLGPGRADVLLTWHPGGRLSGRDPERFALELKVWHPGKPDPLNKSLQQLDTYLDQLGLDTGTLVIFDGRPDREPIGKRTHLTETISPDGRKITLLRA